MNLAKAVVLGIVLCSVSPLAWTDAPKTLNTLRSFPKIESRAEWENRAKEIREHILVSCGLWPLPPKTGLNAKIFDRVERDGYTIEKVYFETYPGFFLAGNLYRPLNKGSGPFPGVLNPHGHWANGRMADTDLGSLAARCITFARQGMVAFSYDMVGYNDTRQVNHEFARNPTNQLWSISLMGLQTWNSLRALDFLESLPDVDKKRLACTGESGGGTQTFMLGAIDDRLAVLAPVVMVSHSMQGGCLCENAPGLRVDYSNMEIAAVSAPRPQILVAATGDWTKTTMTTEGPAIEGIYKLYNAPDRLRYVIFDYPHNYNKPSREAVYQWFGKWLLSETNAEKLKEPDYKKEPDDQLRVFPDKLPDGALNETQLITSLISTAKKQLAELAPKDEAGLSHWKRTIQPIWEHSLHLQHNSPRPPSSSPTAEKSEGKLKLKEFTLARSHANDKLHCLQASPTEVKGSQVAILIYPEGKSGMDNLDKGGNRNLANALLARGIPILTADLFLTGDSADLDVASKRQPFQNYFTTHNRTDLQERVADIQLLTRYARSQFPNKKVILAGEGIAGVWTLLAAPLADGIVADAAQFEPTTENLLDPHMFMPGFYRFDGFSGALLLAAPNPVLVHNLHPALELQKVSGLYKQLSRPSSIQLQPSKMDTQSIADWITRSL